MRYIGEFKNQDLIGMYVVAVGQRKLGRIVNILPDRSDVIVITWEDGTTSEGFDLWLKWFPVFSTREEAEEAMLHSWETMFNKHISWEKIIG